MADSNFSSVSLLLHCNGTDASTSFSDSGPVGHTVTANGNAQVDTAQSKYGGASGLFDGTGDYLTIPDATSLNLTSGNLTIELWVRLSSTASTRTLISKASGTGTPQYRISYDAGNVWFSFEATNAANNDTLVLVHDVSGVSTNTWYHIAVVRNGNVWTIYQDGVAGDSLTWNNSLFATTQSVSIGAANNGSQSLNGWIDDVRITKGIARYTADFTPPTAEFEGPGDVTGYVTVETMLSSDVQLLGTSTLPDEQYFPNVSLLLHCDGTDASTTFTDFSSQPKTVTAVGNAQVDTAQSKFGGASALFDGTGDALTVPNSVAFEMGSGDFTVEFWVRLNSTAANQTLIQKGASLQPFQFYYDSAASRFRFNCTNDGGSPQIFITSSGAPSTGTWYHLAGVRTGSTFRFFVDGVQAGTQTYTGALYVNTDVVSIGGLADGTISLNGWIDDVRITKGVGRYTANFTVRTTAFPNGSEIFGITSLDTILGGSVGAKAFGPLTWATTSLPTILGGSAGVLSTGFTDFTPATVGLPIRYVMDLVIDQDPLTKLRVPISSWQGTQQTDNKSYLVCVVPACEPWLESLQIALEFIISRVVTLSDGSVLECEMARAPLETLQTDEGPTNQTASISGYTDPYATVENPSALTDRTLTDIRSISVYETGVRLRCGIDWLLRPSQRAFYGGTSFIASYINYYVQSNTSSVDEYMDVGERIQV